jgi:hypothetical protein
MERIEVDSNAMSYMKSTIGTLRKSRVKLN